MTNKKSNLLNLDYLIFSSHKSSTQSIRQSLLSSGINCIHCHDLANRDIDKKDFPKILKEYRDENGKGLNIITVFREPIERHISSFFQWYGTMPLEQKLVDSPRDTIIFKNTVPCLQRKLVAEIEEGVLVGQADSLYQICEVLNIDIRDLKFDLERGYGEFESDFYTIYLLRFDILVNDMPFLLSEITGKTVGGRNANRSSEKWYRDIYREFKQTFKLPESTIYKIYESKLDCFDLFYPGQYKTRLNLALSKFSKLGS